MTHPIRDWRNKVGRFADRDGEVLSQDELAALVGVRSTSTLSMIETGDRKPSLALAAKLEKLTGIPISEFAAFEKPLLEAAE